MRRWSSRLAYPNSTAAPTLMSSPMNVSAFGEMRVRASPCTILCRITAQPLPKAPVQVIVLLPAVASSLFLLIVHGADVQDLHLALAAGRYHDGFVALLLAHEGP